MTDAPGCLAFVLGFAAFFVLCLVLTVLWEIFTWVLVR
jgi:hypothetical protein